MTEAEEKASKISTAAGRSIVVGVLHLCLAGVYLIDGSPNFMNDGFVLYVILGLFVLWPYQLVLTIKLLILRAAFTKYSGAVLSVFSFVLIEYIS